MRTEEMQAMHRQLEEHNKMKIAAKDYNDWVKYINEEYGDKDEDVVNRWNTLAYTVSKGRLWDAFIQNEHAQAENEMVKKSEAMSRQVGGNHYKDKLVQPWDVIDTFTHAEAIGFYRGNAIKYIMRAGDKGPAREDYEKAVHYLQKLLEIL